MPKDENGLEPDWTWVIPALAAGLGAGIGFLVTRDGTGAIVGVAIGGAIGALPIVAGGG